MQRSRQWIVSFLSVVLLAGCGAAVATTQSSGTPSPGEAATEIPMAPTAENTPTLIPTATIPPTTSPLPTFTPPVADTSVATVGPAATAAPTTPPAAPSGDPTEAAIALVRERYATINNAASSYRRTETDLQGFSTEGGRLEAYYDGNELRKMVATYLGETGKATEEYYYWDGSLFFVFRSDDTYDKPFGTVVQTTENRYYFGGGRMIRWINEAKTQVPPNESSFIERQAQVTQQGIDLRALLP